jgi:hypothetical protein
MPLLNTTLDTPIDFPMFFSELGPNRELHLTITGIGAFRITPEIKRQAEALFNGPAGEATTTELSIVAVLMTMLR